MSESGCVGVIRTQTVWVGFGFGGYILVHRWPSSPPRCAQFVMVEDTRPSTVVEACARHDVVSYSWSWHKRSSNSCCVGWTRQLPSVRNATQMSTVAAQSFSFCSYGLKDGVRPKATCSKLGLPSISRVSRRDRRRVCNRLTRRSRVTGHRRLCQRRHGQRRRQPAYHQCQTPDGV